MARTAPVRATRRPFTLIVCTACAADDGSAALDALRATVRRCAHGVLVTTACLLEANACAGSGTRGVTVVLQPCEVDRRPRGTARWLGPFDRSVDVRAVCRWLERGDWDARSHVDSHN